MFRKISAIVILGVIADERTCPEPWTGKWGKKFKKSFKDFFDHSDHKGTDFLKRIKKVACLVNKAVNPEKFEMMHVYQN